MAKHKLNIDYDYDFMLLGIACHEPDLKFVWLVNSKLHMDFSKSADIFIHEKKNAEPIVFGLFHHYDEEIYTDFHIIVNKTERGILIPEQKQSDYLLKISGNFSEEEKKGMINKLKEINNIIMVFDIEAGKLKSKQHLIF